MEHADRSFHVEVLTPTGTVCSLEAAGVIFPASDGQLGVKAGRAPMVARLGAGLMAVTRRDGEQERYFVRGGVAEMGARGLTVMADECLLVDRIDAEQAWEEIQAARKMPFTTPQQREARQLAVDAARRKFALAQEKREGKQWGQE